ncbi:uncharacterized protein CEXT_556781 [Caerostris extrusa]|uniref:SWIM-type domain-containing protein n=1 Tax=Caerostris extrusa TaxID=172846 RepID=A0AAV4S6I0_CAEEX|nr:uncharacterized protein CEXT_556781 [Caerostris extrusa]
MSDDAPEYYNAWEIVMGSTQYQLLCPWFVDKNWRKNLGKINPQVKKITVYKTLRVLMQEPNLESFTGMEKNFVQLLEDDPDTRKFKKFYSTYYAQRVQLWTFCYRKPLGINTNMYLESFHKALNHVYLEGKKIKRIDKTLNALMKLTKEKIFERMCNVARNVPSFSLTNIHQSQTQSKLIADEMIIPIVDDKEWKVNVVPETALSYFVKKTSDPICHSCKYSTLPFNYNACIHEYECTCYDNLIKLNFCEHIQACLRVSESKKSQLSGNQEAVITEIPEEQSSYQNSDVKLLFNKKLEFLKEMSKTAFSKNTYLQGNTFLDKCILLFKESKEVNAATSAVN